MTLSIVTNIFIIAGVTRHWIRYDNNTELAETQQEATKIQKEASYGTGCQETYQNAN
jgi:hypothetical protein